MANSYPISVLLNGNNDLHHLHSQLHTKFVCVCVCVYKTPTTPNVTPTCAIKLNFNLNLLYMPQNSSKNTFLEVKYTCECKLFSL